MKLAKTIIVVALCLCSVSIGLFAKDKLPNFVFFITDDVGWNDIGCYGNSFVKTPHLDALAERGLRFDQAYLTISSCSPSRCSIITSRYPHNTGAPELHTDLPPGQPLFPKKLRDAGYYTLLSGKHHMGKNADPAFETISKGKGPGSSDDWIDLLQRRPTDRPFFAWFASKDAHRGWQIDEKNETYRPEDIAVPPFLFDGADTRKDLAEYFHEISRIDTTMGSIVRELERQNIQDNTYVFFLTDNGRPFPRCKTRLYDSGIKTPFLVSCPGRVEVGSTQSIISSIDIGPTILELAKLQKDPRMQGQSFASVLSDPSQKTRTIAFAEQNWHVYQAHQRMVRFGDFLYIKNSFPEKRALCMEGDPSFPAGAELWREEKAGNLQEAQRDLFLSPRPAEELYSVQSDPYQLRNLANEEEHLEVVKKARQKLADWSDQTGDTIPTDPTPDRQDPYGNRIKGHSHRELPGEAREATQMNHPGPIWE